jgi:hypothetical protein
MKHYSLKSITDFNAEEMYGHWLTVVQLPKAMASQHLKEPKTA